jgi:hypothetical protein
VNQKATRTSARHRKNRENEIAERELTVDRTGIAQVTEGM